MGHYQVFISYRRDGGDAMAGRIADRLTALGYDVFFDVDSMHPGTFNDQIFKAIDACKDVIVVLPPNGLDRCANEDDWVRQELAYAIAHSKNIIPVMMPSFSFPEKLPAELSVLRYMEGVVAHSEYFDAMIQKITSMLKSRVARKSRGVLVGLLVVCLAVAAVAFGLAGSPLFGKDETNNSLMESATTTASDFSSNTTPVVGGDETNNSLMESATTTASDSSSNTAPVVGEARIDAAIDYTRLPTDLTNNSLHTALQMPLDAMVGAAIDADEEQWYVFTTQEDVVVYRLMCLCVKNIDSTYDIGLRVVLYNDRGMKQQEFYATAYEDYNYRGSMDLVLEKNTTYYLRVRADTTLSSVTTGYGLFVAPLVSDTGVDQETATEIYLDTENTFVLNSTLADWLKFTPDESGTYRVTIYNVDVDGSVNVGGCGAVAGKGDSGHRNVTLKAGETVYYDIKATRGDCPYGTYIIVIEKLDR